MNRTSSIDQKRVPIKTTFNFKFLDSNVPCKNVSVTTYSYNKYAFDPTEHDHLCSAEVIKAKLKMAEDVLDHLCIDYEKRL